MDLTALIVYGVINAVMIAYYLFSGKSRYFEFPFWAGFIGLVWFLPQAYGGYKNLHVLPEEYYTRCMLFAALCTLALCVGYVQGARKSNIPTLMHSYDQTPMYKGLTILCLLGFFFQYKLQVLPEEMLKSSLWSGATVKYLFLSGMFTIGFTGLFIMYLCERRLFNTRYVLLIPCIILLLAPVLLAGRRGSTMYLIAFTLFPLWFVRRWAIPRIWIGVGLLVGMLLLNAIGLYRSAMEISDGRPFVERIKLAAQQDYVEANQELLDKPGVEFENYIYRMAACEKLGAYDYGLFHWNIFVFNYVPAQFVGRTVKQGLMIDFVSASEAGRKVFGFQGAGGATQTGYTDAFSSFGYLGFIKFWILGWVMGALYRHAMMGYFLPQLMYAFGLRSAMESITHSTNEGLVKVWVYFFIFAFVPLYCSKLSPTGPARLDQR